MSDIDRLAQNIGGVSGKIDQATAETRNAAQEADDTSAAAEALGADAVASQLAQLKGHLDALAATLNSASTQADGIRALALRADTETAQGRSSGSQLLPTPASDPAVVPTRSPGRSVPKRGGGGKRLAELTEQSEGASDLTSLAEKTFSAVAQAFKNAPEPPTVTGAGTRTPNSPPIATSVAATGPDLPTAANGFAAVGLLAFGLKYALKRTVRGFRLKEQIPEEIPPPPQTRYPWDDDPGPDSRP